MGHLQFVHSRSTYVLGSQECDLFNRFSSKDASFSEVDVHARNLHDFIILHISASAPLVPTLHPRYSTLYNRTFDSTNLHFSPSKIDSTPAP